MSRCVVKSRIADNGLESNATKRARREPAPDLSKFVCFGSSMKGVDKETVARSLRSVRRNKIDKYV